MPTLQDHSERNSRSHLPSKWLPLGFVLATSCDPGHGMEWSGTLPSDAGSQVACVQSALEDASFAHGVKVGFHDPKAKTVENEKVATLHPVYISFVADSEEFTYIEEEKFRWFRIVLENGLSVDRRGESLVTKAAERSYRAISAACPAFQEFSSIKKEFW